jgi:hypothetical protein
MALAVERPLAISMWDFSWLERRWPGAGYEDWDRALDELAERGYDAVRIDAYPHLVATDPEREWTLLPVWDQHDWGAPARVRVRVLPALVEFVAKCRDRNIKVGLSTWCRRDTTDAWALLSTTGSMAAAWRVTIEHLERAGLLDALLYVDLGNEFPLALWNPYLYDGDEERSSLSRTLPEIERWLVDPVEELRKSYPDLPYTWSFCHEWGNWEKQDVSALDLLELHIWMAYPETSEFYRRIGFELGPDRWDRRWYELLAERAATAYRDERERWLATLQASIDTATAWSVAANLPLITTECWGPINYKDGPHLDWGWVEDVCAHGVEAASRTGRWAAIATSNFCGPQFVGMWRDVEWHQRLTAIIRNGPVPA